MEKIKIVKNNIFWGLVLWFIGWVLGVILFMTPAKDYMAWIITPIGTIITLWVLFKKIHREQYMCYLGVAVFWTVIAVVMDYFFNVLLFNIGASYYKLDIYIYYALTFILPLLVGAYKFRKTKNLIITTAVILVLLIISGFFVWYLPKQNLKKADNNMQINLANPASENCIQKGGNLEIRGNKQGQYGVCLFEDNRQCEEWALLRGQCPVGGLKITGYDNDAEIYCAITGGQVEGVGTATPMCKRIDGTYCNAEANLNGECPDPNNPNPNAGNIEIP